jgi:hypothetical protein
MKFYAVVNEKARAASPKDVFFEITRQMAIVTTADSMQHQVWVKSKWIHCLFPRAVCVPNLFILTCIGLAES